MPTAVLRTDTLRRRIAALNPDGTLSSASFATVDLSLDNCRLRTRVESQADAPKSGLAEFSAHVPMDLNLPLCPAPVEILAVQVDSDALGGRLEATVFGRSIECEIAAGTSAADVAAIVGSSIREIIDTVRADIRPLERDPTQIEVTSFVGEEPLFAVQVAVPGVTITVRANHAHCLVRGRVSSSMAKKLRQAATLVVMPGEAA